MEANPLQSMTSECPEAFLSSLETMAVPTTTQTVEWSKKKLKDLRPLGHEVFLWAKSALELVAQVGQDRHPADLKAFLNRWQPALPISPPSGPFHLLLSQTGKDCQISGSSLPWMRDPSWAALLQMPALRSNWIRGLRASHFDHLMRLLPASWLMDPTPLPPGCVIPGLEISNWVDLVTLRNQGRCFKIQSAHSAFTLSELQSASEWQTLSKTVPLAVLVEQHRSSAWILARYEQEAGKIHLSDAWVAENGVLFAAQQIRTN
jgi:hypothetical protein